MSDSIPYHTETILCPECGATQIAEVLHTQPWASRVHTCVCGYIIMESEWQAAPTFEQEVAATTAAREETRRENARIRESISRLQRSTAAHNPARGQ